MQSDEELSHDEEMEDDDDPSYVPDPKEVDAYDDDDNAGLDDFDDCLYE